MNCRILIVVALFVTGCVTPPEKRALRTDLPKAISLEETIKVYGWGFEKKHWAELPPGRYEFKFTHDGGSYYMRENRAITLETFFPKREGIGGIVYWPRTGRWHAFSAIDGPVTVMMGGAYITTGEKGKLSPMLMGVIPDEILSKMKDEANQPLEPTPIAITPRADARVAPATGVAHL
jgi:hypothetical protein